MPRALVVLVLAVSSLVSACTPETTAELRIGLLALGDERYRASSGEPSVRGAQLAAADINQAGGILIDGHHHMVRIVVAEHAARADAAATEARGLLNQDSVHALVGPQLSDHAIAVSVIAEAANVPMISPMSTNQETTLNKRFVFRLASLDEVQGAVMARYALERLGASRAAVLFDEAAPYSRDLVSRFMATFETGGGSVVAEERYTTDQASDFTDQLRRIAETDPDVLYLPNAAREDTIQMRQARELGIASHFLGSDSWDLLTFAGLPWSEGAVVTHQWHYSLPNSDVEEFLAHFRDVYDRTPRTTAAMTYDAVMILARAVDRAGALDPEGIRARIAATNDYRGVTGTISFRGGSNPDRSVSISTVRDGEVVVLELIDP